jgi:hypothetical protein
MVAFNPNLADVIATKSPLTILETVRVAMRDGPVSFLLLSICKISVRLSAQRLRRKFRILVSGSAPDGVRAAGEPNA